MNDMSAVITPKSDQLNSDDLIAGPRTITITKVAVRAQAGEQPVSIFFEGDDGKPWKPCKSMARVLVHAWGADASAYTGRRLTLYRDPAVTWGGMQVGGIRISHMSHIEAAFTIALTATRGSRKPFAVKPLAAGPSDPNPTPDNPCALLLSASASDRECKEWAKRLRDMIEAAPTPGFALTWAELNEEPLLRIAARSPRLAAWVREALLADPPDNEVVDAANRADGPAGRVSSPAPRSGAASTTMEGAE